MQGYDIYISSVLYAFHFTLYACLTCFICAAVFNYIIRTTVLVYGYFPPKYMCILKICLIEQRRSSVGRYLISPYNSGYF